MMGQREKVRALGGESVREREIRRNRTKVSYIQSVGVISVGCRFTEDHKGTSKRFFFKPILNLISNHFWFVPLSLVSTALCPRKDSEEKFQWLPFLMKI